MKKVIGAAVLLVALGAATVSADQLVGGMIVQTGPVACDGQTHETVWQPPVAAPVHLRRTHTWTGATYKGVADIWVHVTTGTTLVSLMQWDHYLDPTAPTYYDVDLGQNSIVVDPAGLKVVWGCVPFTSSPVTTVDVIFAVWWSGSAAKLKRPLNTITKLERKK